MSRRRHGDDINLREGGRHATHHLVGRDACPRRRTRERRHRPCRRRARVTGSRHRRTAALRRRSRGDPLRGRLRRRRAGGRPRADRARDRGRSRRDRPGRDSARRLPGARSAPAQLPVPRRGLAVHRLGLEPAGAEPRGPGVALRGLLHLDPGPDREQDDAPAGSGLADSRARTALPRDGRGPPDRMADLGHHQRADVDARPARSSVGAWLLRATTSRAAISGR